MSQEYILLVDDEKSILQAIERVLTLDGLAARSTTDSAEALQWLKEDPPAVIVSDQRMPQMTGVELMLRARQLSPQSVRILMSAYSDIDVVISAINSGQIFQYIGKPWKDAELLDKVRAALQFRREQLQKEQIVLQSLRDKEKWKELLALSDSRIQRTMEYTANALKKILHVKDADLLQHSLRVSRYAVQVAERMGVLPQRQTDLKYAGWFHDIGKIAIRDQILYKKGRLDESEFLSMKHHPVYGAEILREIEGWSAVAEIVLQHHEKYDGTGYPRNLKGTEILLEARILAVADAYDALVSKRVYHEGLSVDQAMGILKQDAGSHFDHAIVNCFFGLNPICEFPWGDEAAEV